MSNKGRSKHSHSGASGNGHGGSKASFGSQQQTSPPHHHTNASKGNRGSANYAQSSAGVAVKSDHLSVEVMTAMPPSTASSILDNARLAQTAAKFDHSRSLPLMIKKAERYRDITCPRKKITVVDGKHAVEVFGSLLDPKVVNDPHSASLRRRAQAAAHTDRSAPDHGTKEMEVMYEKHDIWEFKDFAAYGLGTMLYFDYLKQLAIMFALVGILMLPTMIFNIAADNTTYTTSGYRLEKTTLGNLGRLVTDNTTNKAYVNMGTYTIEKGTLGTINTILDVIATVFLIGYVIYINKRQAIKTADYKRRSVTSPQYTIQVTKLPPSTDRLKLAQFFSRFGPVVDVAVSYNNYELIEKYKYRGKLRKDVQSAISHKDWERVEELWAKIGALDIEIKHLSRQSHVKQVMAAFVTFERQQDRIACVRAYNSP